MKKVTLNWIAEFNTDEEVEEFIKRVAYAHAEYYGTSVAAQDLLSTGAYVGTRNNITVTTEETE